MKILECSSIGDKRFSALFAKVKVFDKVDVIENHYQLSKRFGEYAPTHWTDVKGKKSKVKGMELTHIVINNKEYELRLLSQWYNLLWLKYLDNKPHYVEFLKTFDDYNDTFKGNSSQNCQADVIRKYIKQGRLIILEECSELLNLLKQG